MDQNSRNLAKNSKIYFEKLPDGSKDKKCSNCGGQATLMAAFRDKREPCCNGDRCKVKVADGLKALIKSLRYGTCDLATARA